jgi:peptide/nickel transport system ATP-binding protein
VTGEDTQPQTSHQAASEALLTVRHLKKHFPIRKGLLRRVVGYVRAVDDVSFQIPRGKTLGLVGESGCGKSTLGRSVIRAIEPTSGQVTLRIDGRDINLTGLPPKQLRATRRHMQMVFQDPYSSLDPRKTILNIVGEPLRVNNMAHGEDLERRVRELMDIVSLDVKYLKRYPHAFSGGQRQRIGIARALSLNPELIVCDEPVSALDVSVQAQILNLLDDLQKEFNLTYLFIAHNLSVVEHISDQVAVMYVGKIVELAQTAELYRNPKHPYTEALLSAIPRPDPLQPLEEIPLEGEVANPANPPTGCYFHPRCRYAQPVCKETAPPFIDVGNGHFAACHFADELDLRGVG